MGSRVRTFITAIIAAASLLAAGSAEAAAATAAPTEGVKVGVISVDHLPNGETLTVSIEKVDPSMRLSTSSKSVSSNAAHPDTAVNCVGDFPSYLHETCFGIYGSGLFVSYMESTAENLTGYPIEMNTDIQRGSGVIIGESGWATVPAGYQITYTWNVQADVAAQTFCGGGFGNDGYTDYVCEPISD